MRFAPLAAERTPCTILITHHFTVDAVEYVQVSALEPFVPRSGGTASRAAWRTAPAGCGICWRKEWSLLPISIVVLLTGTLLVFAQASVPAPFVYTILSVPPGMRPLAPVTGWVRYK